MMTDPIADMIARIKNATKERLEHVRIPLSKIKRGIAHILKEEGYISGYEVKQEHPPTLTIDLKYTETGRSAIVGMRRKSRPGRRVYAGTKELVAPLGGMGIAIVSTSKGLMTDKSASEHEIGGEVLAEVW